MHQHRRAKDKKTPTSHDTPYPPGFTSAAVGVNGSGTSPGSVLPRGTIQIGAACKTTPLILYTVL